MTPSEYAEWRRARPKIVEAEHEEAVAAGGGPAFTSKDIKHRGVQKWYLSKIEAKVRGSMKRCKRASQANIEIHVRMCDAFNL